MDKTVGEPMEFEWNIFPGFTTLQLCNKVQDCLSKMSEEPEESTGRIIFMSMFNDISWRSKDNEKECESSAQLVSIYAKRFSPGRWSFLGPGSEKKWYSTHDTKPQEEWDRVEELMIKFSESGHPIFRATSPLSRGTLKSKGGGKLSIHFCTDEGTIETVCRTLVSVNQLSFYGAGFLTTVEVGQYFMTKDTEEFSQFTDSVACREYTLPRDEKSSDPKGWIRTNTEIWPVLEVTTSYLQGKYGVEIRIESVNKDNSHSCVRISHGLNKLATDLSNNKEDDNNKQETSEMQFEDFALKTNVLAFASRSKAKAKPRRRTPACSFTRTVPIGERHWTDIEPETYSPIAYPVSKRLSTLLRHGNLPREEDGEIFQHETSVFASSWRRSRVILIEKHFKPICNKITPATHSVTNRKRWFVKWAM